MSSPSGRIFISYRRQATSHPAGRLYDCLVAHLGKDHVFMDVDSIEPGMDFGDVIAREVATCDALLAVIGPEWATLTNEDGGRRLDDSDDVVRLEIAAALERDIRVIPILVEGAVMPRRHELPDVLQGLVRRHALTVRHESFREDSSRLIAAIDRILQTIAPKSVTPVTMPELGESITQGTVTRWLKREGDRVEADEPLFEVSTDKVDTEVPSPTAGLLKFIRVQAEETVDVGTELAFIQETH